VIEREVFLRSTVLAFEVIALENILTREIYTAIGSLNIAVEPDNG